VRARRVFWGLVLGLSAGVFHLSGYACNVYDPSLLELDKTDRPPSKNGIGWWSKKDEKGCFSAGVPTEGDRPPPKGDKDVGPITLAVRTMRLGSLNEQQALDPNAWQDIGFDIDGVCTASETCDVAGSELPPQSCKAGASALPRDGRHCRDNTFGRLEHAAALVPELSKKYGLSDDAFNCALCVGHYNFLIKITGYNGEADDDRLRVDLYPSPGLEKPFPWDCTQPDWRQKPCFTPDMPWTIQEDVLTEKRPGPDLPSSKLFDDNAYVREGYLVTHLPGDTLFWFPGYAGVVVAYPLRIQQGVVAGKLVRGPDGVYRIDDGMVAGRTKGEDLVKAFRLIGLCETTDSNYSIMTDFISANVDVITDGRSDPNVPCDGMSLGIAFTALQAKAGRLETVEPLVECVQPKTKLNPGPDGGADGGTGDGG
jgi:hypothetical protein